MKVFRHYRKFRERGFQRKNALILAIKYRDL